MHTLNKQAVTKIIINTDEIEKNAHHERAKATQELIQAAKNLFRLKAKRYLFDEKNLHPKVRKG